MKKINSFDLRAYWLLISVLLLAGLAFFLSSPLKGQRVEMIVALSGWYFSWSLWYQQKKGVLGARAVLENLLIAILGALLLFGLI